MSSTRQTRPICGRDCEQARAYLTSLPYAQQLPGVLPVLPPLARIETLAPTGRSRCSSCIACKIADRCSSSSPTPSNASSQSNATHRSYEESGPVYADRLVGSTSRVIPWCNTRYIADDYTVRGASRTTLSEGLKVRWDSPSHEDRVILLSPTSPMSKIAQRKAVKRVTPSSLLMRLKANGRTTSMMPKGTRMLSAYSGIRQRDLRVVISQRRCVGARNWLKLPTKWQEFSTWSDAMLNPRILALSAFCPSE